IVFAGSALRGLQHFDAGNSELRLAQGSAGRLDLNESATAHGLSVTQDAGKGGAPLQMNAGDFALSAHLDGIDAPRFLPALRAIAALGSATAAKAAAPAVDSAK